MDGGQEVRTSEGSPTLQLEVGALDFSFFIILLWQSFHFQAEEETREEAKMRNALLFEQKTNSAAGARPADRPSRDPPVQQLLISIKLAKQEKRHLAKWAGWPSHFPGETEDWAFSSPASKVLTFSLDLVKSALFQKRIYEFADAMEP